MQWLCQQQTYREPRGTNDEGIALRSKTDEKRGAAAENGEVHVANGAAV